METLLGCGLKTQIIQLGEHQHPPVFILSDSIDMMNFDLALQWFLRTAASCLKNPALVASILVTGSVIGIRQVGGLQPAELLIFDQMMQLRSQTEIDQRLLIVEITEEDIRKQNRWPISDAVVARMLQNLQQHEPRAIGLDIYRDVPQPPGRSQLLQELRASNVITITLLGNAATDHVPSPAEVSQERIGYSDLVLDVDAVVRRNWLYAKDGDKQLYSFALRLSLAYLAHSNLSFRVRGDAVEIGGVMFPALHPQSGSYQEMDDRGYQVLLNYGSSKRIARQVTLTQVLNGQFDPAWVKDKVILVGTTAPSAKDLFLTPFNRAAENSPKTSGVLIHAHMVNQILSTVLDGRSLFWFWSEPGEIFWIWIWSLVGGLLVWNFRHPLLLSGATAMTLSGLLVVCFVLFLQAGWVPLLPAAMALVGTSVAVVVYKRLYDAFHDALTGLPNRALFVQYLNWAIAQRKSLVFASHQAEPAVAVLFLGLDNFKAINDSFGHRLGDQLLVAITQRLRTCLRSTDQLARVGGDEFAILRQQVSDTEEVTNVADLLQKQVTQPFKLAGREVFTTASVGIVLGRHDSEYEPEDILRDAHTALHRAKASGKSRHEVFVTGMRDQVMTRLQLETDLRHAIERQEFRLYYQPLITLDTGKIAGFEALVRWQHPQRGFVSPADFIPVAEETDLIIPLGQWIIQEACHQLHQWQEKFPKDPPLLVSINLSGKQFAQSDLVEQIEQTLQTTELDGRHLKLEITESIAMTDVEATIALLLRLRALNLQISIDDFGTGYSSLSYLHRFPSNTIKVDRSFVSRMVGIENEDSHIVQTIIMLGHNLGMDIVAEGVETTEQLRRLRSLRCEYGQGYLFSKPVAADLAEALLQENPTW
jgi:diguanylate cyclase (GGDEF)-like protein